jgi:hypothetical protein
MRAAIAALLALLVGLAALGPARAEGTKGAAEAAFRKGKQLMDAGDTAAACDAFAQSQKLDPQLGTQYNLARCYEQLGMVASAWLNFAEIAAKDTNPQRKADSAKRARALDGRVPRIRLDAPAVPGMIVKQDGVDITVTIGVDTPIDAGRYTITATAPGRAPWSQIVEVSDAGHITITIPPLAPAVAPTTPPEQVEHDLEPPPPAHPGRVRHILGVSVGVAGLGALGASIFFGSQARDHQRSADALCGGAVARCTAGGLDAARAEIATARDRATYGNIAVATGAVLVGVGVVLYLTAPHAERPMTALRPIVAPDQLGLVVDGRW